MKLVETGYEPVVLEVRDKKEEDIGLRGSEVICP